MFRYSAKYWNHLKLSISKIWINFINDVCESCSQTIHAQMIDDNSINHLSLPHLLKCTKHFMLKIIRLIRQSVHKVKQCRGPIEHLSDQWGKLSPSQPLRASQLGRMRQRQHWYLAGLNNIESYLTCKIEEYDPKIVSYIFFEQSSTMQLVTRKTSTLNRKTTFNFHDFNLGNLLKKIWRLCSQGLRNAWLKQKCLPVKHQFHTLYINTNEQAYVMHDWSKNVYQWSTNSIVYS